MNSLPKFQTTHFSHNFFISPSSSISPPHHIPLDLPNHKKSTWTKCFQKLPPFILGQRWNQLKNRRRTKEISLSKINISKNFTNIFPSFATYQYHPGSIISNHSTTNVIFRVSFPTLPTFLHAKLPLIFLLKPVPENFKLETFFLVSNSHNSKHWPFSSHVPHHHQHIKHPSHLTKSFK